MTTNGQAPFITLFMYLNEAHNQREKDDLAMLIEEELRQSYLGVKMKKAFTLHLHFQKLFMFFRRTIFMKKINIGILLRWQLSVL